MNKEEKEAIEYIKAFQKDLYGASEKNLMAIYIDRVWNYIDKLQKENEELKKDYQKQWEESCRLALNVDKVRIDNDNILKYTAKNYISKDKIRDMQRYREFELQQEYKEFEDDIEWQTYNKILEEE